MPKRLMGGVLSGLLLVAMVPGVASAESHKGHCPKGGGWEHVRAVLVTELDVGNGSDQNGDGMVCARVNPGQTRTSPDGTELWTVKDNTN